MPILIDTKDVDEFVETVVRIAPGFGGIHLEDISTPDCFEIERRLIEALPQPVMHDDVHGTAVVTLAALIAACRQAGIRLDEAVVGQIGLGAAGFGIATLIHDAGVRRVLASDPNPAAQEHARARGIEIADLETLMREADVVVATSGQPGLIKPEMVRKGQVIFALTNPAAEIDPDAALAAGAAFAADGTSINNVLGYPGIFKGALLAGASEINLEMKRAAAWALAGLTVSSELIPEVLDLKVHEVVTEAVRQAAIESGVADLERISAEFPARPHEAETSPPRQRAAPPYLKQHRPLEIGSKVWAMRAVRFDRYGDRDVLYVADVEMPQPAAGEALVEVRAAGDQPRRGEHPQGPICMSGSQHVPVGRGHGSGRSDHRRRRRRDRVRSGRRGARMVLGPLEPRGVRDGSGHAARAQAGRPQLGGRGVAERRRRDRLGGGRRRRAAAR